MTRSTTDRTLKELWEREAASGESRDEVFLRTLASALGLDPDTDDDRDFVTEVWLALGTRGCSDVPLPPPKGLSIARALRVAVRLDRFAARMIGDNAYRALRIKKTASAAEARHQALRDRELKRDKQDQAIHAAVTREIARNGKRGAYVSVAKRLAGRHGAAMTPQNVGQRFRAWEARLATESESDEKAKSIEALKSRLLSRRS